MQDEQRKGLQHVGNLGDIQVYADKDIEQPAKVIRQDSIMLGSLDTPEKIQAEKDAIVEIKKKYKI